MTLRDLIESSGADIDRILAVQLGTFQSGDIQVEAEWSFDAMDGGRLRIILDLRHLKPVAS